MTLVALGLKTKSQLFMSSEQFVPCWQNL